MTAAITPEAVFAAAAAQDARAVGEAPQSWEPPAAITASELESARIAPRCIVENYLYADVGTLIAPGSTGKTTAVLYEAVCIVLGLPVWGLRVVTPGPVLIVTAEDRREYLVARLRQIMVELRLTAPQLHQVLDQVRIDDATTQRRRLTCIVGDAVHASGFGDAIVKGCAASGFAPVLVTFDPLVSFGVGEARTNDAEQGLIEAGRIIVAGLDACVRFVHHTGKANARDKALDQYAGRGGSALADGCRMVAVMAAIDDAEIRKLTGDGLAEGESAFRIERPKLSYAAPQKTALIVRRRGYAFSLARARAPMSDEDRLRVVGEQLARFIESQHAAGAKHTRHTLEQVRPENLSRQDVRAGLAWLAACGWLWDEDIVDATGKRPAAGARSCLRARISGEPSARPGL